MSERLSIYTDRAIGRIEPDVYGQFIEHLGYCIYDGIWVGEDSGIPNVEGIRQEAIDVLRDISAPIIRWPGGYFADCYDWRDGIGPREERPIRFHEVCPNKEETNSFGTHEFFRLCELTGAEANICVNTAMLTALDAANWVEYCCHDGRTSYAALRRKNGRKEPWKVKFWGIGNESYWLHRPQDYVQRFLLWKKHMSRLDRDIKCIGSMVEPTWHPDPFGPLDDWLQEVIGGIRGNMELASLHLYSHGGTGADFSETEYWDLLAQVDQRNRLRIESIMGAIDSVVGDQRVKLSLDEWGALHSDHVKGTWQQECTFRDALFAARFFHLIQGYPNRIGLATIAQTFNLGHALLWTEGPRSYRTPTCHIFEMFKNHQGGNALRYVHSTPQFEAPIQENVLTTTSAVDMVTVSPSLSDDGQHLFITMTNADLAKSYTYDIDLVGSFCASSGRVRAYSADPWARNSFDDPEAVRPGDPKVLDVSTGRISVDIPPCSVIAIDLQGLRS